MPPQPHIYLALAFHNHQPVGNFDFVFAEAYEKAYLPMLEALEKHGSIRLALHYTGPLRDWIVKNRPGFFPRVAELARRGQVEILTGGYYEPLLVAIPDADKIGQVAMMSDTVRHDFAFSPSGAWLAERVWEPQLAKPLAQAGVEYIIVDDTHFKHVGLSDEDLFGYYITEEQGYTLKIFGTSKHLRYSIPWESVDDVVEWLRRQARVDAAGKAPRVAVMGDDGEKFGLWPQTYQHVWENGWMDRFFTAIEASGDWLETIAPGEYARRFPAVGRIYLPTASYDEMTEWALPADLSADITELKHRLQDEGKTDVLRFVRGGFWRHFLVKYPEVNNMHKKMLRVHDKVRDWPIARGANGARTEALDHLWAGQCNCPYWHGVFGGIYLSHIRTANYAELIAAEDLADRARHTEPNWVDIVEVDFDLDSQGDLILETPRMVLNLRPSSGGALFEWDWRDKRFNLLNSFSRHKEGYHRTLVRAAQSGELLKGDETPQERDKVVNIHDLVRAKEAGLENYLFYDWYQRDSLIDHFLHPRVSLADFRRAEYGETGDFVLEPYQYRIDRAGNAGAATLWRDGHVWVSDVFNPIRVEKRVDLNGTDTILSVRYAVTNTGEVVVDSRFGVEWNFALLSGHAPDAYYELPDRPLADRHLDSIGEETEVGRLALVHEWFKLRIGLSFDRTATVWRLPIETISNSEGGFERTYQSSCLLPHWALHLAPGETWMLNIRAQLADPRT